MRNAHLRRVLGLLAAGTFITAGPAHAQQYDEAALRYGEGVHAYFAGNSSRAEQFLSDALQTESRDPRPYYFRALSLLRLGRGDEARGDMVVGATLEAQQPNRFAVGEALIRVQGHDRLLLEKFRREARLEAAAAGPPASEPAQAQDAGVLRRQVVIPLEEFLRPGAPKMTAPRATDSAPPPTFAPGVEPAVPGSRPDDPFLDDLQSPPAGAPVTSPTTKQPAPSDPPVHGDEDTTRDESATPATSTPPEPTPPPGDEDPFSGQ